LLQNTSYCRRFKLLENATLRLLSVGSATSRQMARLVHSSSGQALSDMRRSPGRDHPITCRGDLKRARRVVIKAGTSVVTNDDGYFSLTRVASLVEQIASLMQSDYEVILVSSGATGCGRQKLHKQSLMSKAMNAMLKHTMQPGGGVGMKSAAGYNSACAAAGQLGLMSLYDTLFSQCDIAAAQFLVTSYDFTDESRRSHLKQTMNEILGHGMVPIVNENDAVSGNKGYTAEDVFSDNDALAAIVAGELDAEVLILLTDVEGLYDRPPSSPGATIIDTYNKHIMTSKGPGNGGVEFGEKSARGRGGMDAKVNSAMACLEKGAQAVVIASGHHAGTIFEVMNGSQVGTLFIDDAEAAIAENNGGEDSVGSAFGGTASSDADGRGAGLSGEAQATAARGAARALQVLTSEERSGAMLAVAAALRRHASEILDANALDLSAAKANQTHHTLVQRLKMTEAKLETLAKGVETLADMEEPIGELLGKTELADGLVLDKVTVPIGVLLIVFESRPDSLPQIAALSLRSGNGLLLKGGKEAEHSNACLHRVIVDAIFDATAGRVARGIIALVTKREEVSDLLRLDGLIDLVIPRGGKALVEHIKKHTRIPVLGHADGICHVYVDDGATDGAKAARIAVDAKVNYPAACNAAEAILLHAKCDPSVQMAVISGLRQAGVALKAGPNAITAGLFSAADAAESLSIEYGVLTCLVEVVPDMDAAIDHIHAHGSSHTGTMRFVSMLLSPFVRMSGGCLDGVVGGLVCSFLPH
jgi:delta-1-pyrroline-5-carboxylate synthetase